MKDEWLSVLTPIFLHQLKCQLSAGSSSALVSTGSYLIGSGSTGTTFAGLTKCHIWFHCEHQVTWRCVPSAGGVDWHQHDDLRKGSSRANSPAVQLFPHWWFSALLFFRDFITSVKLLAAQSWYNSSFQWTSINATFIFVYRNYFFCHFLDNLYCCFCFVFLSCCRVPEFVCNLMKLCDWI